MSRLTTRNDDGQAFLQNYFDPRGDSKMWVEEAARRNREAIEKLARYEDLEENAVDFGYLHDWYIGSVTDAEPVWTDAHLEELVNDFILIPKDVQTIVG